MVARVSPARRPRARVQTVSTHGLTIRASVSGRSSAHPLLLINGIGAPLELWSDFRARMGRETIAFDAPGTGGSPAPLRPRSMWELARAVDGMLDQLGFRSVDVLGISWGGGLAEHLALLRRSRVRRLVLLNTGFGAGSIPARPVVALELLRPTRYFSPGHLARIGPALFGGETRRRPELLRYQGALRSRHRPSALGYLNQLLAAATWVALPWLPLIRARTLVLQGSDDPIVHVINARVLAAMIPDASLRIIRGAGHVFPLDQSAEASAIVRDFLDAP